MLGEIPNPIQGVLSPKQPVHAIGSARAGRPFLDNGDTEVHVSETTGQPTVSGFWTDPGLDLFVWVIHESGLALWLLIRLLGWEYGHQTDPGSDLLVWAIRESGLA